MDELVNGVYNVIVREPRLVKTDYMFMLIICLGADVDILCCM